MASTASDMYAGLISLEKLQTFKALTALPETLLEELASIEQLNVSTFNEAEVRYNIIDPIVRILGYRKDSVFSVDLERQLTILGKSRYPDYKFTLWDADFWLIEAKAPRHGIENFDYDDLSQALEYASHPKINAALLVLCDGLKIEVFDREFDLNAPLLHVDLRHLRRDFDKLRLLLEPWQVWLFQKRRIVRLLDKVFNREFNLTRVEEFKSLLNGRLNGKRHIILENFRRNMKPDSEEQKDHISNAPVEELVEVHLFLSHSIPMFNALIAALVRHSQPGSFRTLFQIFPDQPRDTTDTYHGQSLFYLMALAEARSTVEWLPAWLNPTQGAERTLDPAIQRLLRLCLTHFRDDEPRKTISLVSAAFRRVLKILLMSSEEQWRVAEVLHFVDRYQMPELSWQQAVASPGGQMLRMLEGASLGATSRFVSGCRDERGGIKSEVAKLQLKSIWRLEVSLLAGIENYPKLRAERDLGETHPTELTSVTYDYLGHLILCLIPRFPRWRDYVLEAHDEEIRTLASLGSWSACDLLGIKQQDEYPMLDDEGIAARFFYGDVETLKALRAGYAGTSATG